MFIIELRQTKTRPTGLEPVTYGLEIRTVYKFLKLGKLLSYK